MPNVFTTFRNPIASVWQYAIHKAISMQRPKALLDLSSTEPEMTQFTTALSAFQSGRPIPQTDSVGSVIGQCAKLAAEFVWAEITGDKTRATTIQDQIQDGTCDPLWTSALAIYLVWKASFKPAPYLRYSNLADFVIPLPDKPELVVGLIADWGTGLDDARWLLSEVMKKTPDVLIHLGDIYYAGMSDEDRDNFLAIINSATPNIPVYTLSGNHDMYSGGAPYYWLLTQLNAAPSLRQYRQQASYFCLRNASWQILAMDTGFHDCDPATVATNVTFLEPSEATWHTDKLQNSGGRRSILLSHHQLFTAFGDGVGQGNSGKALAYNPRLYSVFQPFIGSIALWLWGHEHNFEVFDPYSGLNKGRCIGASAIPVLQSQDPYGPISNPDLQDQNALPALVPSVDQLSMNSDKVYFHNYALMTLRIPGGTTLPSRIDYYEVDSSNHGESELMFGEIIP
jgi:Calcineurin-like phosphoesterase